MCATKDQRACALWRIFRQPKADPSAHRVAEVVRCLQTEVIQDGGHVHCPEPKIIGCWLVRLIAPSMPASIHQNDLVIVAERIDIAKVSPIFSAPNEP